MRATGEATPHHLVLTDEAVRSLDSNLKMNPPLRSADDRAALVDAVRDGTIAVIATDHAPHAPHEKDVPFEEAPFGVTGLETAFAALNTHLVGPGLLTLATLLERMSAGPARAYGLEPPRDRRSGRRRTSSCSTRRPRGASATAASARARRTRGCSARPLKGKVRLTVAAGRIAYEASMTGFLGLEDGTVFRGESVGAEGRRLRRGGVRDRDDRLPGARHRPELRRSRSSASRRRWSATTASPRGARSRAASTSRACVMREARGPAWTDWLVEHGVSRSTGSTRARSSCTCASGARCGPRDRGDGSSESPRPRAAVDGGQGARRRRLDAGAVPLRGEVGRVNVAVVDYGTKRSILRRLAGAGAAVTVYPHDVDADTLAGYDGVVLSNGPGDPDPLVEETRGRPRPARPHARVRDLPRPPAARRSPPGTRRSSSRSATAARTTPCSTRDVGPRARHLAEPRLRGRRPTEDSRGDGDLALRRHGRGLRLPRPARAVGAVPSGGGPGPARRLAAARDLGRGACRGSTDIDSICLIGSGPIVIGQACEFDYAGCQALKVLREDGFRTIVVNSNPATIMTDPGFADRTYLEPLDLEGVADVLERERPDALLPTLGGQTALNLSMQLAEAGVLDTLGVELIGAGIDAIKRAEDRELFREAVRSVGLRVPTSRIVTSLDDLAGVSLPGGHPARRSRSAATAAASPYTTEELRAQVETRPRESPIGQVLVEESVRGWDEFELEVMRDKRDNVVIVCSIENLDPMGVHTGDSVTVAPQMTLSDEAYQELRDASAAVIRAVGVETGGSNIQFARERETGELRVIEMNPRVSRSSALASKATGYPIAKVAAKLAVGYTLDEIPNDLTKTTPASFEPTLDYVVVKFPRFAFEKFPGADRTLGTQMKSVGEAMGIGRTFREAFWKAMRSRELDAGAVTPWEILDDLPEDSTRGSGASSSACGTKGRRPASASTAASTRAPARSRPSRTTTTRPSARPTSRRRSPTRRAS